MKQTKEGFCAIWPKPMRKNYSLLKYFMGLNANYIEMAKIHGTPKIFFEN
jgi:hypothetical protein